MPAPSDEEAFYLRCFWDLSTCRALGFGVAGPIPYSAMREMAYDEELDDETRRIFITTMREMDKVFLQWCEAEREANKPK